MMMTTRAFRRESRAGPPLLVLAEEDATVDAVDLPDTFERVEDADEATFRLVDAIAAAAAAAEPEAPFFLSVALEL